MPASCFHFNPLLRLLPTFPKCRLQHLKTVALDIFVGWEAPVESLGLPTGAWGGLKVTLVQTKAGPDISRQNTFLFRCFVNTACQVEKHFLDAFIGVGTLTRLLKASIY